MVEFNLNAALGRHFLPHPRQVLRVGLSGFCNLLCRFCASSKNESHKFMPIDLFQDVINQATDMGYSIIELTPIRGEIFMDRGEIFMDKSFFKKMQYLDNHPKITEYDFFTNLVVPSEQTIQELFQLGKLKILRVSVYGHADIIQEQMDGKFRPICKNCTIYHSIYKATTARDWVYNLDQVKTLLSK